MSCFLVRHDDPGVPPVPAVQEHDCSFCQPQPFGPCLGPGGTPLADLWHAPRVELAVATAALVAT